MSLSKLLRLSNLMGVLEGKSKAFTVSRSEINECKESRKQGAFLKWKKQCTVSKAAKLLASKLSGAVHKQKKSLFTACSATHAEEDEAHRENFDRALGILSKLHTRPLLQRW